MLVLSWRQIGAFFLINLCLVVIATQFSETKKREMSRMLAERKRFQTSSTSTLASSSEPGGCYDELIKYASHIGRKVRRRLQRFRRRVARNHRRRRVTPERAAVAVSLRRRRRRRSARTRQRSEAVQQQPAASSPPPVTATPPTAARSPAITRANTVASSSPEHGPAQKPVREFKRQPSTDQQHHADAQPQQQQTETAQRPDFLRMPSRDSVGYASIVSVLSWSSLPTPSVYLSSPPRQGRDGGQTEVGNCPRHDSEDSDSVSATRYLVLPLELTTTVSKVPLSASCMRVA